MFDRNPPAKTSDPACGSRERRDAAAARPRRRSLTLSGLLLAILVLGSARVAAAKTPPAPKRKTYRPRGGRAEKLSSNSAQHGAPKGAWKNPVGFSAPNSQSKRPAETSRMTLKSRDVRLCHRPCRRASGKCSARARRFSPQLSGAVRRGRIHAVGCAAASLGPDESVYDERVGRILTCENAAEFLPVRLRRASSLSPKAHQTHIVVLGPFAGEASHVGNQALPQRLDALGVRPDLTS